MDTTITVYSAELCQATAVWSLKEIDFSDVRPPGPCSTDFLWSPQKDWSIVIPSIHAETYSEDVNIYFKSGELIPEVMAWFPLPRRLRSFQGPHSTCMQTAETVSKQASERSQHSIFDFVLHEAIIFHHLRFTIYLTSGLLTIFAFLLSALAFFLTFGFLHLFLRFQYKLSILLLMMQHQIIDFNALNKAFLYYIHMLMILIGGFGWILVLFIEL